MKDAMSLMARMRPPGPRRSMSAVGSRTDSTRTSPLGRLTLLGGAPDVILATGTSTLGPLLRLTRIVPIVFVFVPDPLGSGFVKSLSRPGGNATGFMAFEYSLSAKWLELLKQIAPGVSAGDRRNRSASRTEGDIS
jgi:hypothetical protein